MKKRKKNVKYDLRLHSALQVDPVLARNNMEGADITFYNGDSIVDYALVSAALKGKALSLNMRPPENWTKTGNDLYIILREKERARFIGFWKAVKREPWPHPTVSIVSVENISF